ncbi:MAG: hypothetical protein P4M08_04875 [Oligoflexia bacterium]|nr:hypothetical protein [Oligoflexia bacterium]
MDIGAWREFNSYVPAGGKILDASRATGLGATSDLRLVSLPREEYDAVWAHESLFGYKADECRRAMATFFLTLKPRGILFVSFEENEEFHADDYASLVRQHGFTLISSGRDARYPERVAFIARRI